MIKQTYYSALDKTDKAASYPPMQRAEFNNGVAFRADIMEWDSFKHEFDKCDLLYTEMPWRAGHDEFYARASRLPLGDYDEMLKQVSSIIEENRSTKAVVMVCGKSFASKLPKPDFTTPTMLHDYPALVLIYNHVGSLNTDTNYTIIDSLAKEYYCVGDFMAGFGNTGQIFAKHNKDFVLSELNPRCIGYMSENL